MDKFHSVDNIVMIINQSCKYGSCYLLLGSNTGHTCCMQEALRWQPLHVAFPFNLYKMQVEMQTSLCKVRRGFTWLCYFDSKAAKIGMIIPSHFSFSVSLSGFVLSTNQLFCFLLAMKDIFLTQSTWLVGGGSKDLPGVNVKRVQALIQLFLLMIINEMLLPKANILGRVKTSFVL